jgi:TolB protein
MSDDGRGISRLTSSGVSISHPDWSPDGKQIVYSSHENGSWKLFRLEIDKSELNQLTSAQALDSMPDWGGLAKLSEAGPWLFQLHFSRDRDADGQPDYSSQLFAAHEELAFLIFNYSHMQAGLPWQHIWTHESGFEVVHAGFWDAGEFGILAVAYRAPGRLAPGVWQVRLLVDGMVLQEASMSVIESDERSVVFSSWTGVDSLGLYFMHADGTGLKNLTGNRVYDSFPALSPDGTRIAFMSERHEDQEIYAMSVEGRDVIRLTDLRGPDTQPAWSPDGEHIAFISDRDGDREIYLMNADGSGILRLTSNKDEESSPAWSPDGKRIAYISRQGEVVSIVILDLEGNQIARFLEDQTPKSSLAWSPDGDEILIASEYSGNSEIYLLEVDTGLLFNLSSHASNEKLPAWSSDGELILFASDRSGTWEIYRMYADGSHVLQLTDMNLNIHSLDW